MRSFLEIYDLTEGTSRLVLEVEGRIEAPNWDPDGQSLLINGQGLLYRVPLVDPEMIAVETGPAIRCNNDHGISPDGSQIVLSSHHEGAGSQIYLIPAAGGEPAKVSPQAPSWWHGWSPDGKTLAYVAARGGSRVVDVYTLTLGNEEQRLTWGEGHCDGPDYSADGSRIYYNCDRSGHAQIWVMQADGSGQRQLFADDQVNWFPHPSPDGQLVLYLAYPEGTEGHPADLEVSLWLMDPEGGDRRQVLSFTGGQGTMNVPNWAPDSRAFAYVRYAP
ncbi:MAG: TolB family protein [Cypionkella sp.]